MFFFFQAEDGIRDTSVTGVQTCALPIWQRAAHLERAGPNDVGELGADAFQWRNRRQFSFIHLISLNSDVLGVEAVKPSGRSEEHTSERQSPMYLVCRLLLEKKNNRSSRS